MILPWLAVRQRDEATTPNLPPNAPPVKWLSSPRPQQKKPSGFETGQHPSLDVISNVLSCGFAPGSRSKKATETTTSWAPGARPSAAILIFSSSASCRRFALARRFWNQILTWVSVSRSDELNSARSAMLRYCFSRNFFSSDSSCWVVNGAPKAHVTRRTGKNIDPFPAVRCRPNEQTQANTRERSFNHNKTPSTVGETH
uniref:Uncharacterized protein n=1 Tax=Anopheles coluzzii TaxID=1518534 RepID=A0A8W7PCG5_ANOCL